MNRKFIFTLTIIFMSANSSASPAIEDFVGIVELWGKKTAKDWGTELEWFDLYGEREENTTGQKLTIEYGTPTFQEVDKSFGVGVNNKTIFSKVVENKGSGEIVHTLNAAVEYEESIMAQTTRGITLGLQTSLSLKIPQFESIGVQIGLNAEFNTSTTNQTLRTSRRSWELTDQINTPPAKKKVIKYIVTESKLSDVPFEVPIYISGGVVFGFKQAIPYFSKEDFGPLSFMDKCALKLNTKDYKNKIHVKSIVSIINKSPRKDSFKLLAENSSLLFEARGKYSGNIVVDSMLTAEESPI